MANIIPCEDGIKVKLIGAMPRESYVDIAASITRSEKTLDEIAMMPYNEDLVKKVVSMNHLATTEFDYFVFAVEGLSRVTEIQLVRKRLASYMIKSGRVEKKGKRTFDVVKPKSLAFPRPAPSALRIHTGQSGCRACPGNEGRRYNAQAYRIPAT
jgi:hypothetical protein